MLDGEALGDMDVSQLAALPGALRQIAGGLEDTGASLTTLQTGFGTAYTALASSIDGIPEATLSEQQLQALYQATDPAQYDALNQLVFAYQAAQTVKGTFDRVKTAFESVDGAIDRIVPSLDTLAGQMGTMADSIEGALAGLDTESLVESLGSLASGMRQLSDSYVTFHQGLAGYIGGVEEIADGYGPVSYTHL